MYDTLSVGWGLFEIWGVFGTKRDKMVSCYQYSVPEGTFGVWLVGDWGEGSRFVGEEETANKIVENYSIMQNKTWLGILSLTALFILSCNLNNNKKQNNQSDSLPNQVGLKPKGLLLSNSIVHAFSDPILKDTFKLFIRGGSIVKGNVLFEIVSHNNKLIYHETFAANELLEDDYQDSTIKIKEDSITRRFKDFFGESNFLIPATSVDSSYELEIIKDKDWDDIKSDNTSIGFIYSHFYEGAQAIAYSKKRKKVIIYFSVD